MVGRKKCLNLLEGKNEIARHHNQGHLVKEEKKAILREICREENERAVSKSAFPRSEAGRIKINTGQLKEGKTRIKAQSHSSCRSIHARECPSLH